jgi:hypothetical protein
MRRNAVQRGIWVPTQHLLCGKPHLNTFFHHSAPNQKKTQRFSITKINWFMLLREIVTVYSENYTKPISALCGYSADVLTLKVDGTYSYHWALKS